MVKPLFFIAIAAALSSCCFVNRVERECEVLPGGLRSCVCRSLDTGYVTESGCAR